MIILMLFIRRNLRLKTLHMLQNGLIILTFIWSLMRMVNFSHDSIYDKRDDFDVPIVNFPYLSRNIPKSTVYGVFVSQLIRCSQVCSFRGSIKFLKLLKQGYSSQKLPTTFRKLYGCDTDLVQKCNTSVLYMLNVLFTNCDTTGLPLL